MTGWIHLPDGSWQRAGSAEHLTRVWEEFTQLHGLPPNFQDEPLNAYAPTRACDFKGQLHPLVLDAWAYHWHATYQARFENGRTYIIFTYYERQGERT